MESFHITVFGEGNNEEICRIELEENEYYINASNVMQQACAILESSGVFENVNFHGFILKTPSGEFISSDTPLHKGDVVHLHSCKGVKKWCEVLVNDSVTVIFEASKTNFITSAVVDLNGIQATTRANCIDMACALLNYNALEWRCGEDDTDTLCRGGDVLFAKKKDIVTFNNNNNTKKLEVNIGKSLFLKDTIDDFLQRPPQSVAQELINIISTTHSELVCRMECPIRGATQFALVLYSYGELHNTILLRHCRVLDIERPFDYMICKKGKNVPVETVFPGKHYQLCKIKKET